MARLYAARLTEKDKSFLNVVMRYGVVTVTAAGLKSAGLEGDAKMSVWRCKRLMALGYLTPNNDGLFDGCPQTYRVTIPVRDEAGAAGNMQTLPNGAVSPQPVCC